MPLARSTRHRGRAARRQEGAQQVPAGKTKAGADRRSASNCQTDPTTIASPLKGKQPRRKHCLAPRTPPRGLP